MFSESQLVLPAIDVIRAHGGACDTADIIATLRATLPLDSYDNELLPSGGFRFNQIVYNLKCHKVLEKMGLVTHVGDGFMLTEKGMTVETDELQNIVVVHFAPSTNILTPQAAMVEYVTDNNLQFENRQKAAGEIIKLFNTHPKPANDTERRALMKTVIDEYIDER